MSLYQAEKDGDLDALVGYLARSGNETVRERAARLLGVFEGEQVTEALIESVDTDDSPAVRAAAVDSLDAIGIEAVFACMERIASFERASEADWVAVDDIAAVLDSPQPEIRMAAASALAHLDEPRAVSVLTHALSDSDPRVRERVARACGSLGHPQAIVPLEARFDDESADVRREAAVALGRIATDSALSVLLDRIDDSSETVRYIVVSALGESGRPEPVAALAEATADPSVLDPLIEILESGDRSVQKRNAAWLLGQLTGPARKRRVVDGLISLLDDDDGLTAQVAVTSLVSIGDTAAEQRLLTFALDERRNENARAKAVFALGQIGDERTRERLDRLIDTTNADPVRRQAFSAVAKLDGGSE